MTAKHDVIHSCAHLSLYHKLVWNRFVLPDCCSTQVVLSSAPPQFTLAAAFLPCEQPAHILLFYFNLTHDVRKMFQGITWTESPCVIAANLQIWANAQPLLFAWTLRTRARVCFREMRAHYFASGLGNPTWADATRALQLTRDTKVKLKLSTPVANCQRIRTSPTISPSALIAALSNLPWHQFSCHAPTNMDAQVVSWNYEKPNVKVLFYPSLLHACRAWFWVDCCRCLANLFEKHARQTLACNSTTKCTVF